MIKRILIFIFCLPSVLFAQKDSNSKLTFKIKKIKKDSISNSYKTWGALNNNICTVVFARIYCDGNLNHVVADVNEILKYPKIEVAGQRDSARVISFSVRDSSVNGVYFDLHTTGNTLTKEMQKQFKQLAELGGYKTAGGYAIIKDIRYVSNKDTLSARNIILVFRQ